MASLLGLPYEIRALIYSRVFQDTTTFVRPRTNIVTSLCCTVEVPKEHDLLLVCRQCHDEARPIMCGTTNFVYAGQFVTTDITTLCSKTTRTNMRHLYGIVGFNSIGLSFTTADEMHACFPNLEVLGITQNLSNLLTFAKHDFDALTYDKFVALLAQWNVGYGPVMRLFATARFRTYIKTTVVLRFFGDNSRDIERVCTLFVDVKGRRITRDAYLVAEHDPRVSHTFRWTSDLEYYWSSYEASDCRPPVEDDLDL